MGYLTTSEGDEAMNGDLKEKLRRQYYAVVVDKTLVSKEGIRSLPSYVSEWLVRRFFADGVTEEARQRMHEFVSKHLPPQGKREEVKAKLRTLGKYTIIDEFTVMTDLRQNRFVLRVPSLDIRDAYVEDQIVHTHPMLLASGVWGAGRLVYEQDDDSEKMIVRMDQFEPIQLSSFDLALYMEKRTPFDIDEWIDILVQSQGLNPAAYTPDQRLLLVCRMLPITQANLNLVELAPKGTGKTFLFKNLSYYSHVISGGTVTPAALFYNLGPRSMPGLLALNDVVVFDEVQTIGFEKPNETMGILKDYMESGSYHRGHRKVAASSSIVFLGNIELNESGTPARSHWFEELPKSMRETAFIHRLHAFLPGWELPKINVSDVALAPGLGLAADYLSEALHALRSCHEFDRSVSIRVRVLGTEDIRDEKAIQRVSAGLLRLLFPNLHVDDRDYASYCVEPAIRFRQLVRSQLHLMDPEFPDYELSYELLPEPATAGLKNTPT